MPAVISHLMGDQTASVNARLVAGMRCLLSLAALLIIFIDPHEPDRFVVATYAALISYFIFSLIVFLFVLFERTFILPALNNPYWLDVAWYLLLISLSSGTGSIFFFFLYFAILNASFLGGYRSGLKVTFVSAVGFAVIGYMMADSNFELNRFLIRPLSLLALGYMFSFWGGFQKKALQRLDLLRDIGMRSNPRFGAERTVTTNLELLRSFFNADVCLMVTREGERGEPVLRKTDRRSEGTGPSIQPLDERFADELLSLAPTCAAVYQSSFLQRDRVDSFDTATKKFYDAVREPFISLAERLDAQSFITAPVRHRGQDVGRVFIIAENSRPFESSDIPFLLQAIDHFYPIVENIRLIDRLASDAADEERKKIARDIHDSIIQPYIGLQMGIDSVARVLRDSNGDGVPEAGIKDRIERLRELTDRGIEDLRAYVSGLSGTRSTGAALMPSIKRFSEKFTFATGIKVEIECSDRLQVTDRLAAELFQIVAESLSNVRRHTQSPWARIFLSIQGNNICLAVSNAGINGAAAFTPRSISERAAALGGSVRTEMDDETVVTVEIPL